jgi:hypothetical protein
VHQSRRLALSTIRNDRPAPAQLVHALSSSGHGLVPIRVVGVEVVVKQYIDGVVQRLTDPGVPVCVARHEILLHVSDVSLVDGFVGLYLALVVNASEVAPDRRPREARLLLVREESDNAAHIGRGRISEVFQSLAQELVGVPVGLLALG